VRVKMEVNEIDFSKIIQLIKKKLILVIAITFICAASTAFVSYYVMKPEYKADISVRIGAAKSADGKTTFVGSTSSIALYQQLVRTYSVYAKSRLLAADIATKLMLDKTPGQVMGMITVTPDENTQFITISVKSGNADEALRIANQAARSLKSIAMNMEYGDSVQLVDDAQLTNTPLTSTRIKYIAAAFIFGAIASFILIYLAESMDRTVKDPEKLEAITGISVVGSLPKVKNREKKKYMDVLQDSNSVILESYRTLRNNLQCSLINKDLRIIAVSSCFPAEGKSTVVSNLAKIVAESGKKTLLIDCDLRKPTAHMRFGLSNSHGLTSLLLKESTMQQCIYDTELDNLKVIPSGPIVPDPSEMLGSASMKELLEEVRGAFDLILLDTSSILTFSDALAMINSIDGTLLVSVYGFTENEAVLTAKHACEKSGAKIIGIVENKIPRSASHYGYGYGYSSKYHNPHYSH